MWRELLSFRVYVRLWWDVMNLECMFSSSTALTPRDAFSSSFTFPVDHFLLVWTILSLLFFVLLILQSILSSPVVFYNRRFFFFFLCLCCKCYSSRRRRRLYNWLRKISSSSRCWWSELHGCRRVSRDCCMRLRHVCPSSLSQNATQRSDDLSLQVWSIADSRQPRTSIAHLLRPTHKSTELAS